MSVCDDGYFKDSKNNCQKCSEGCLKCTTFDTCSECDSTNKYFLKEGKCQTKCGINFTIVDKECKRCSDPKCNYCAIGDPSKCNDCLPYPRRQDKCVAACDEKTYLNKETFRCEECSKNCLKCYNQNTCSKCEEPFVLEEKTCKKECSPGYRLNIETKICESCQDSNCLKCNEKTDECKVCASGLVLLKGKCENSCPSNYFKKESKEGVICEKCPCKACENENKCTNCDSDKVLFDGKCKEECPDRFYAKYNDFGIRVCLQCLNNSCLKCSENNPEICISCPDGKRSYFDKKANKLECLDICKIGTFEEVSTDRNKVTCIDCVLPCVECKSKSQCTKCSREFSLYSGKCESDCPSGFTKSQDGNCVECGKENCSKCPADNLNKCLECQNGYLFYPSNTCKPECPEKYRGVVSGNGKKECVACPSNCKKCDENGCKECFPNFFFLYESNECGICSTFDVIINKERCAKCQAENCDICEESQPKQCRQCKNNYININGECKKDCPVGFYKDENVKCQACRPECTTCNVKDSCLGCKDEKFILSEDGKCTDKCAPQFAAVNGKCKKCETLDCNVCEKNNLKNCQQCLENFSLYKNQCIKVCPKGTRSSFITIEGIISNVCIDCPVGCSECNEKQCIRCDYEGGFYMQNGVCVKECHIGYSLEVFEKDKVKNGICVKCPGDNCKECSKDVCFKCAQDSFEYIINEKLNCLTSCHEGTFMDKVQMKCVDCSANCKICLSKTQCNKCDKDFILYADNQCLKECPEGFTKVVSEISSSNSFNKDIPLIGFFLLFPFF